jgi:hypothetical protein
MSAQGIQDIIDLFDLIDGALDAFIAAKADGSIDWKDALKFLKLYDEIKAAVAGLQNLLPQVKDLDGAELEVVAGRAIASVQKAMTLFA